VKAGRVVGGHLPQPYNQIRANFEVSFNCKARSLYSRSYLEVHSIYHIAHLATLFCEAWEARC